MVSELDEHLLYPVRESELEEIGLLQFLVVLIGSSSIHIQYSTGCRVHEQVERNCMHRSLFCEIGWAVSYNLHFQAIVEGRNSIFSLISTSVYDAICPALSCAFYCIKQAQECQFEFLSCKENCALLANGLETRDSFVGQLSCLYMNVRRTSTMLVLLSIFLVCFQISTFRDLG